MPMSLPPPTEPKHHQERFIRNEHAETESPSSSPKKCALRGRRKRQHRRHVILYSASIEDASLSLSSTPVEGAKQVPQLARELRGRQRKRYKRQIRAGVYQAQKTVQKNTSLRRVKVEVGSKDPGLSSGKEPTESSAQATARRLPHWLLQRVFDSPDKSQGIIPFLQRDVNENDLILTARMVREVAQVGGSDRAALLEILIQRSTAVQVTHLGALKVARLMPLASMTRLCEIDYIGRITPMMLQEAVQNTSDPAGSLPLVQFLLGQVEPQELHTCIKAVLRSAMWSPASGCTIVEGILVTNPSFRVAKDLLRERFRVPEWSYLQLSPLGGPVGSFLDRCELSDLTPGMLRDAFLAQNYTSCRAFLDRKPDVSLDARMSASVLLGPGRFERPEMAAFKRVFTLKEGDLIDRPDLLDTIRGPDFFEIVEPPVTETVLRLAAYRGDVETFSRLQSLSGVKLNGVILALAVANWRHNRKLFRHLLPQIAPEMVTMDVLSTAACRFAAEDLEELISLYPLVRLTENLLLETLKLRLPAVERIKVLLEHADSRTLAPGPEFWISLIRFGHVNTVDVLRLLMGIWKPKISDRLLVAASESHQPLETIHLLFEMDPEYRVTEEALEAVFRASLSLSGPLFRDDVLTLLLQRCNESIFTERVIAASANLTERLIASHTSLERLRLSASDVRLIAENCNHRTSWAGDRALETYLARGGGMDLSQHVLEVICGTFSTRVMSLLLSKNPDTKITDSMKACAMNNESGEMLSYLMNRTSGVITVAMLEQLLEKRQAPAVWEALLRYEHAAVEDSSGIILHMCRQRGGEKYAQQLATRMRHLRFEAVAIEQLYAEVLNGSRNWALFSENDGNPWEPEALRCLPEIFGNVALGHEFFQHLGQCTRRYWGWKPDLVATWDIISGSVDFEWSAFGQAQVTKYLPCEIVKDLSGQWGESLPVGEEVLLAAAGSIWGPSTLAYFLEVHNEVTITAAVFEAAVAAHSAVGLDLLVSKSRSFQVTEAMLTVAIRSRSKKESNWWDWELGYDLIELLLDLSDDGLIQEDLLGLAFRELERKAAMGFLAKSRLGAFTHRHALVMLDKPGWTADDWEDVFDATGTLNLLSREDVVVKACQSLEGRGLLENNGISYAHIARTSQPQQALATSGERGSATASQALQGGGSSDTPLEIDFDAIRNERNPLFSVGAVDGVLVPKFYGVVRDSTLRECARRGEALWFARLLSRAKQQGLRFTRMEMDGLLAAAREGGNRVIYRTCEDLKRRGGMGVDDTSGASKAGP